MRVLKSAVLGAAFSLLALAVVPTVLGAEQFRGNWSIALSKQAGLHHGRAGVARAGGADGGTLEAGRHGEVRNQPPWRRWPVR